MRRSVAGSESWSAKRSRGREGGPKPPAHCGSGRCRAAATEFLLALRGIHRAACRRAKNELIEENAAAVARIRGRRGAASGMPARPVGVYRIQDGTVTWDPALDVTRIAMLGQVVAIIALLVVRSIMRKRRTR